MRTITVSIFVCAFLLMRPYQLQDRNLCYTGDDYSYFAHASSLVFGQFPSYEKEFFVNGDTSPLHSIGPGLMAAPFVFVFSFIDRLEGSDIVHQRTRSNITKSWSMFGFVFAASFYFWIACLLLYKALRYYVPDRHATLAIILTVLCQGIPLFVYRRPIFSHLFEFFLQSLMVYLLLKPRGKIVFNAKEHLKLFGIGVALGLMCLVRYNNAVAAFVWLIVLSGHWYGIGKKNFWKAVVSLGMFFLFFVFAFKLLPTIYNQSTGYGIAKAVNLLRLHSIQFYTERFFYVMFGLDWGLIFTAPFVLIGLIAAVSFRYTMKTQLLICLLPMAVNFHIIVVYLTQGSWYGYRYFFVSIIPLLVYPVAYLLRWSQQKYGKKIYALWIFIALFPLLSMLSFEGNNTTLTLTILEDKFEKWGNVTYQLEVWKMLFFHPLELSIAIFKGGLLYLIYLMAHLFNAANLLPAIVLEKYPEFRFSALVKTIIIYTIPFILYNISRRKGLNKPV